jgi:hypothetical protein
MANQLVSKLNSCIPTHVSNKRGTCFLKHTPYMQLKHINECTDNRKLTLKPETERNRGKKKRKKEKIQRVYSI